MTQNKFWTGHGWSSEYADARTFRDEWIALKEAAAREASLPGCQIIVIQNCGLKDERVL